MCVKKWRRNLDYNYFRYYDPSTGRYITSDPIGLEGGLNTYTYVYNSPTHWIDTYGLDAEDGGYRIPTFIPIPPTVTPDGEQINYTLELPDWISPPWYKNENKKTRKKIKGLQDQVDKHREKIRKNPDSRDVPHWNDEINAWEERIKRLRKRLPGKCE